MDAENVLGRLSDGIRAMTSSENWLAWLKMQSKLHSYSWRNTMLIMMQMPDATMCAGYTTWQRLGRQVRAGEHGLLIQRPIFPSKKALEDGEDRRPFRYGIARTFDISQTDGDPIPETAVCVRGDELLEQRDVLALQLGSAGYNVTFRQEKSRVRGHVLGKDVVVNCGGRDVNDTFRTLVHEAAHQLLTHQERFHDLERGIAEVEAESVAFVVCDRLGAPSDSYSFAYVAGWADGDPDDAEKAIKHSMKGIVDTANTILGWIATCQNGQVTV